MLLYYTNGRKIIINVNDVEMYYVECITIRKYNIPRYKRLPIAQKYVDRNVF